MGERVCARQLPAIQTIHLSNFRTKINERKSTESENKTDEDHEDNADDDGDV